MLLVEPLMTRNIEKRLNTHKCVLVLNMLCSKVIFIARGRKRRQIYVPFFELGQNISLNVL